MCRATLDLGLPLGSTKRKLKVSIQSCAVRIAMSHLVLHRLVKAQFPIMLAALQQPASGPGQGHDSRQSASGAGETVQANAFRQSCNSLEFDISNDVSAWLCNDGGHSFGAPDVLQVCPLLEHTHQCCVHAV